MKTYILTISWLLSISSYALRPISYGSKYSRMTLKTVSDSNQGLLLSTNDIATAKYTYSNLGMPRVLPPGKEDEDWLLWLHARDSNIISDDVVQLSTGRILFGNVDINVDINCA